MKSLKELNPGTDKGDCEHIFNNRTYLDIYDQVFSPLRSQAFTLLEIGVLGGKSVRMWRSYFPSARIVGLDINPEVKVDAGIDLVIGSQDDHKVLNDLVTRFAPFTIIIDDGSHVVDHMLTSFNHLWPHVKSGGWYVIEDMLCTYMDAHPNWPGMQYNKNIPHNNRSKIDELLLSVASNLDHRKGDVDEFRVYASQYFLKKI
jgi:cephalosporin hydroxylase